MRFFRISILGFMIMAGSTCLFGQEGYYLDNLYFTGNETFSDNELIDQISLYTINWFERYILRKDRFIFSEDYLEADLKRLTFFYQQQGYLHAQITFQYLNINHKNRSLDLEIIISENAAVFIREMNYSIQYEDDFNDGTAESLISVLMPLLQLQEGGRFEESYLESDRERVIKQFLNAGYAYVEVEYDILLSDNEKDIEFTWIIMPGPLCHFGDVQIICEKKTSESLIQERVEFNAGDLYQKVLLDTTQQSIYSLGLFQAVSVSSLLNEKKTSVIPVRIIANEAPSITTRVGAGYGSEAKFRAFADIVKISFLGGSRRLQLLLSHSNIEPYNIDLRFTQPSFLTRSLVLVLNPYMLKQDEPGYKVKRRGYKSTFLYSFAHKIISSFTYTYEDVKREVDDFETEVLQFDERYRGLYNKAMTNIGLTWDTSSPMFTPNKGFLTSLNIQYNGVIIAADYPFLKTLFDLRKYQQISTIILGLRLKAGGIIPIWDNEFIPIEERFFSGGSYSVRGWARQQLGPKDITGRPVGGKSVLEFSSELRYPVYGRISGVAFMDCGNVWRNSYTWKLNEIRYSLGIGIRIGTPIGPIRFDIARPVFDEEDEVQFHFSVGNAF